MYILMDTPVSGSILNLELGRFAKRENEAGISAVPDVSNHPIIRIILRGPFKLDLKTKHQK